MKLLCPLMLVIALSAAPLAAEEEVPQGEIGEGMQLLQEGARLMMRGLMGELGPLLHDLQDKIDDLSLYQRPEVLPNGDIIIRRRVQREPEADPDEDTENGDDQEDPLEL